MHICIYIYIYIEDAHGACTAVRFSFEVIPLRKTVNLERFLAELERFFAFLEISNYDQEDIQIAAKCSQNSPK